MDIGPSGGGCCWVVAVFVLAAVVLLGHLALVLAAVGAFLLLGVAGLGAALGAVGALHGSGCCGELLLLGVAALGPCFGLGCCVGLALVLAAVWALLLGVPGIGLGAA